MQVNKIQAMQRYKSEQVHPNESSAYESTLPTRTESIVSKSKKSRSSDDQGQRFQDLLDAMLDHSSEQ